MRDQDDVRVSCLYNVCDLQRVCQDNSLKFSADTNRFLLHLILKKLGPLLAQKLVKHLVDKGELQWDQGEGYDVESILGFAEDENGKEFYEIKWKGWGHSYNTWEPKENLDCETLLQKFHADQLAVKHSARGVKRRLSSDDTSDSQPDKRQRINDLMERILSAPEVTPLKLLTQSPIKNNFARISGLVRNGHRAITLKRGNIYNKRTKTHKQLCKEVQIALKQWEKRINEINTDPAPITVENNVDLEGPPTTFTYINDYKAMSGVIIPDDPIVGCECTNCFDEKKQCCGPNMGAAFAYYKHNKVRVPPGTPIYECNQRCQCNKECPNRVVQNGRKHKVCLFRTHNGRGWGVKALQRIMKGSFVMEYVGEVITNEEAERRGKIYDAEGRTYLFDLDYSDADCPYTVDAGFYGNVSHFVNHSCDPNLAVYGVWINHLDPHLPRIALFAKRSIKAGEELTFDYLMTGDTTQLPQEIINEGLADETKTLPLVTSLSFGPPTEELSLPVPATDEKSPFVDPNNVLNGGLVTGLHSVADDAASDISRVTDFTDVSHATDITDDSHANSEYSTAAMNQPNPFIRRSLASPSPAMKYRIMCQCGATNCRKYLF